MITTLPLSHTHRDLMTRVIRKDDFVVWANGKYGQGLTIARVVSSTPEKVRIDRGEDMGGRTLVYPQNLVVITAQVERNVAGRVGANTDLEATR